MILFSRALNSGSARRRSTASTRALRTVSFKLKPSARAKASTSVASSSGNLTVKFFVMVAWYHRTVRVMGTTAEGGAGALGLSLDLILLCEGDVQAVRRPVKRNVDTDWLSLATSAIGITSGSGGDRPSRYIPE